jgi:hypothetical protein
MAYQLIPAALMTAGKALTGSKLAMAFRNALNLGKGAKATQMMIPGLEVGAQVHKNRMATEALTDAAFKSGLGKAIFGDMSKGQIAGRLGPDAFFGGIAALQTPGDIGDKLIAGTGSALGGGIGGLALGRAGQRFGDTAGFLADAAGSIGGDYIGMSAGDSVMRAKDRLMGGEGLSPYERMSAEQQAAFAEQIRQQTLAGAGLVPGVRDQYMYSNGLG